MLTILFYTFPEGHLVSDKEFARLQKGFEKLDMNLVRWHKDKGNYEQEYMVDIIMVKGFSHTWEDVKYLGKPIVYYSIGSEYKKGIDLEEANRPIKNLSANANTIIHVSSFCEDITDRIFGWRPSSDKEYVIIPSCEPNLPDKYPEFKGRLKLATTCIPRPVKRIEEIERLCEKHNIELVPAYGSVSDFSYYHDCHGYIHLSRKEGMPNTVLEALSYGLPCIVTNYGGAKEAVGDAGIIIKNDYYGIWDPDNIEPIDDFLFEKAIEEFIERLPELRMKVRERVLTVLNDKMCAEQFKQVFDKILR